MPSLKHFAAVLASFVFLAFTASAATPRNAPAAPPSDLERAVAFERDINAGKLKEPQFAQTISELLKLTPTPAAAHAPSADPLFTRALLHAAAAQWLGQSNNGVTVRYAPGAHTAADAPAWLRFYATTTSDDLITYDYIRTLALTRNLNDPDSLRSEVLDYLARARRMDDTPLADALLVHLLRMADLGPDAAGCRAQWLAARRLLRPAALARAGLDKPASATLLLYTRNAYHYKPNVCGAQVSWGYKPGGDLLAVNLQTRETKSLLRDRLGPGHLHGLDLWFDGDRVAFSYAPQPLWPPAPQFETVWPKPQRSNACFAFELRERLEPPHLYELDLRTDRITPLTDHNYWSDTEPAYLPDGSIAFASDRSAHSPSCDSGNNELTDLNLYTLTADRRTVRRFLNHKDIDTHPRLLNNGTLAYLRWEYQERDFMEVHSVWTARPDGTGADAYFKQHIARPYSVRLATPLPPPDNRLLAVATGHHCMPQGALVLLDPATGPNNPAGIQLLTRGVTVPEGNVPYPAPAQGGLLDPNGLYTDPQPVTSESFLASYAYPSPRARRYTYYPFDADANGYGTYLIDVFGNKELLHRDPYLSTYNAVPLRPRHKPPVLTDTTNRSKNYATCTIADVYQGLDGVARGAIKSIRISEALPWPIVPGEGVKRWATNWTRSFNQKVLSGPDGATRWCPVRVIGEVPVEADGSAHFKVPVADSASVYFQALDENHREIRRMRSSVSFAPGEVRGCTGCHETNSSSVANSSRAGAALALKRQPSVPVAPPWGSADPIHYPRDVQPILDRNCVSCHNGAKAPGGLDFTPEKSFKTIMNKRLVVLSNVHSDGGITKVEQFGSRISRLTQAVFKANQPGNSALAGAAAGSAMRVSLSPEEWHTLVTWVDANAPYTGSMFHLRTADGRQKVWADYKWAAPWGNPKESPALGESLPKPLALPVAGRAAESKSKIAQK